MRPINLDDEIEYNPEHASTKMLYDSPGFRAVLFCLDEGQGVPRHVSPNEVMMHVYRGGGTILIGDEEHPVKEGDFMAARPDVMHGFRSEGEKLVILSLIVQLV